MKHKFKGHILYILSVHMQIRRGVCPGVVLYALLGVLQPEGLQQAQLQIPGQIEAELNEEAT